MRRIVTEGLKHIYHLREIGVKDIQTRVEWLNDSSTRAGLNITGGISMGSTHAWLSRVRNDPSRRDYILEFDSVTVAMGGLTNVDSVNRTAELYAMVGPEHKRRGHGSSLVREICSVGFDELNLRRLYLWMFATNVGAGALYNRCGFRHEGTLREHVIRDGKAVDRIVMGLMRREWPGSAR